MLYLCLEDTFCRIQDRLFRLTDEASGRLHFAVASCKLSDGLIVQLEDYLKDYPDSRLIVIDTLQKVRTASKDNAYASDYGDISLIKDFADRHSLAVIVVHHIRKQNDSDVFNKVSAAVNGPPAAPKPAFVMVEAVFKALRWEMVLVPTSIASSNPDDSVAIFKYDPFLKASAEVSVRWIRCRLLFHHQHRMVF